MKDAVGLKAQKSVYIAVFRYHQPGIRSQGMCFEVLPNEMARTCHKQFMN